MDKILSTFSYGICVFSLDGLTSFLKENKIRTKKVVQYLQKNPDMYLKVLEEGIWVPFVGINSIKYLIKLEGYDQPFDDEWEQKFEYFDFNIEVKEGLWFSDLESFYPFENDKFVDGKEVYYQTEALIGTNFETLTTYSAFKYDVPSGKYLLSIKGYKRKQELEFPTPNCGFLFSLVSVKQFDGYNNPREDEIYDFNVANME